jgi:hypothetical protein
VKRCTSSSGAGEIPNKVTIHSKHVSRFVYVLLDSRKSTIYFPFNLRKPPIDKDIERMAGTHSEHQLSPSLVLHLDSKTFVKAQVWYAYYQIAAWFVKPCSRLATDISVRLDYWSFHWR